MLGYDLFSVLQIACINPVKHYNLSIGCLNVGDPADFIVVDNLTDLTLKQTYINGNCVFNSVSSILADETLSSNLPNKFNREPIALNDVLLEARSNKVRAIRIEDGELVTKEIEGLPLVVDNYLQSNVHDDLLKIVVVNRYQNSKPAVGFINGMKLVKGSIATTIAHDSHNIICVGVTDEDIVAAVNEIVSHKGGLCVYHDGIATTLELPIAGLMSNMSVVNTARKYDELEIIARELGSDLKSPFMALEHFIKKFNKENGSK